MKLGFAAFFLSAFVVICCSLPGTVQAASANSNYKPPSRAQLEAGRKIYNFRCYFCHGYSGNAQTVAATYVTPPPKDFTSVNPAQFTPEHIISILQKGKPGTAMQSFRNVLSDSDMALVAAFVVDEFVLRKAPNTRYHTVENGWTNHERYKAAFPFATGEISMDRPWEELSEEQIRGKRLYMSSCITCHDRGESRKSGGAIWEARPLSYPRNNFSYTPLPKVDAIASASPYALHDMPLKIKNMTPLERKGQKLWNANCAFCHAMDGTGKNWIGAFLEPHARNLRDPAFMESMTRERLDATIREGLHGTSMPAWKSILSDKEIKAIIAYISKAFYPLPK